MLLLCRVVDLLARIFYAKSMETIITADKKNGRLKLSEPKEHKTTRERLIEFYGEDFEQFKDQQEEINWGGPVGEEIW